MSDVRNIFTKYRTLKDKKSLYKLTLPQEK